MKNWLSIPGLVCVIGLFGCADAPDAKDAGACQNSSDCICNDGRMGTNVCDVESGEFVMCQCGPERHGQEADSGAPTSGAPAPKQPGAAAVSGLAGRSAADQAGRHAAGSGGQAGAPAAAEQPAAGAGGKAAGHPGKGAEKKRGKGPKGA